MTDDHEDTFGRLAAAARGYFQKPFQAIIEIHLDDRLGCLWVDGHCAPPHVTQTPPRSRMIDCHWAASHKALIRLFSFEERSLEGLYIAGRLQISGDMAVMARLEPNTSR